MGKFTYDNGVVKNTSNVPITVDLLVDDTDGTAIADLVEALLPPLLDTKTAAHHFDKFVVVTATKWEQTKTAWQSSGRTSFGYDVRDAISALFKEGTLELEFANEILERIGLDPIGNKWACTVWVMGKELFTVTVEADDKYAAHDMVLENLEVNLEVSAEYGGEVEDGETSGTAYPYVNNYDLDIDVIVEEA